jgi:esterase/lipase superfamily enzyme
MPNLFVVRSNQGEYSPMFVDGGYIAIGWLEDIDLRNYNSRPELYAAFSRFDDNNINSVAQKVGQIYRFIWEIEIGDYVITQSVDSSIIHYGIVESNYMFKNYVQDKCPFPHRRDVKWISKVSRNSFSVNFQNSLRSILTVFRIEESESFFSLINQDDSNNSQKPRRYQLKDLKIMKYEVKNFRPDELGFGFVRPPEATNITSSKEDQGGVVSLFYGTNRNSTKSTKPNKFYGGELNNQLKVGTCRVSIPRGHREGEIERPINIFGISLGESLGKHIVLEGINELTQKDFLEEISDKVNSLEEKKALIFIHGYNNTFDEAARRTAQIVYDVPFNNGIAGFYSWPSGGRTLGYIRDQDKVDASVPYFEEFISKIVKSTKIEKLHLIAHSMGNRLLTLTLSNLSNKTALTSKLNIFNQIILAAPDIDQSVFENTILPWFKTIGQRRTLYASDKDKALHLSEIIREKNPRLGVAGEFLFVSNGIDTVDASNVPPRENNHSYIFNTKELLTDLFQLLENGSPPNKRRLKPRKKSNLPYWLLPL